MKTEPFLSPDELTTLVNCGIQIMLRAHKMKQIGHNSIKGHLSYCHGDNFTDNFLHWGVGGLSNKKDQVFSFLDDNRYLIKKLMNLQLPEDMRLS